MINTRRNARHVRIKKPQFFSLFFDHDYDTTSIARSSGIARFRLKRESVPRSAGSYKVNSQRRLCVVGQGAAALQTGSVAPGGIRNTSQSSTRQGE